MRFIPALLCLLFLYIPALGQSVLLEWDPNSETDLAGYSIWRSLSAGFGYERIIAIIPCPPGDASCCLYRDETISVGTRYFYVATALDTEDLESGFSNEVTFGLCLGDVNQDQARNILDVLQIANHLAGNLVLEGNALIVADVNEDGAVNVLDSLLLENYLAGNVSLPDCP